MNIHFNTLQLKATRNLRKNGFALIATVIVMSLLLLLSMSMLSLSSVSTRSSSANQHQLEAEANAKLALMLAVSQLQESMGPDQRVSYSASLLDENIDTPEIDRVAQPHWVGFRDTRMNDKEMIYRDDPRGGLFDQRTGQKWDSPTWKKNNTKEWFVSGHDKVGISPLDFDSSKDAIELVRSSSGKSNAVYVPEVNTQNGSFAYWVGDEGQKARVNLSKVKTDLVAFSGVVRAEEKMIKDSFEFQPAERVKALSLGSHNLVATGEKINDYFHDVTDSSCALLTDTLRGNLRQDLSVFKEKGDQEDLKDSSSGVLALGLNSGDSMAGFRNAKEAEAYGVNWDSATHHKFQSPKWGLIKSWGELAQKNSSSSSSMEIQLANRFKESDDDNVVTQQYALDDQSKVDFRPILVESSMYTNLTHRMKGGKRVLRLHIYPRVVLWNPYNVTIKAAPYLVHNRFLGDQNIAVRMADGQSKDVRFHLPSFQSTLSTGNGARKGILIWSLKPVEIGPGECLVFSQAAGGSREYSLTKPTTNVLSAEKAPATDNFYLDDAIYDTANILATFDSTPASFKFNTSSSQDYMTLLQSYPKNSYDSNADYDKMRDEFPLLQTIQVSYKAGAYTNLHGKWNDSIEPSIESTAVGSNKKPNYKTREGYRLRWFEEHDSNLGVASPHRHLQVSHIINANLRNQLHMKCARDFTTYWTEPELFGNYTRDMWHEDVDWNNLEPIPLAGGKFGGNPFAASQEWASEKYVLFEVPTKDEKVISLGKLQHTPLSAFSWHPSYIIGGSFPDPRAPLKSSGYAYEARGGFADGSVGNGYIQALFQRWLQRDPRSKNKEVDQLVYDISYEVNHGLWDRYYLSGETEAAKGLAVDNGESSLGDGHLTIEYGVDKSKLKTELSNFHKSAFYLRKQGGFNINSTSVLAWKAILAANRERKVGSTESTGMTSFPRVSTSESVANGKASEDDESWSGHRALTDDQIDLLANEIVKQVKLRGPFVSVSDFVNRRLSDKPEVRYGVIQQAIVNAGLNDDFNDYKIDLTAVAGNFSDRMKQEYKAPHSAAGAPGYLTQGDVLQSISPALFARSDTFKVRAYGSSKDASGNVIATAYCEAVVQRSASPINPDESGINPVKDDNWGRKFNVVSFRWLSKDEL